MVLSALALAVMDGCGTGGCAGAGADGSAETSGPSEPQTSSGAGGSGGGAGGADVSGAGGAGGADVSGAGGAGGADVSGAGGAGGADVSGAGGAGGAEEVPGGGSAGGTAGAGGDSAEDPPPVALALSGDVQGVHDPSIIKAGELYHVFSTGPGIPIRSSTDLLHWRLAGAVFSAHPDWVASRVGDVDSLWAPDISYWGGVYHLYYAASRFGTNRSCIGHATTADLAAAGGWADHGPVLCSEGTDHNAIDPNVVIDERGTAWLAFGSFWSGLKLVQLAGDGTPIDGTLTSIAARPSTAIEAPFLVKRDDHYYLFASFDTCCAGARSTYKIMVGRSLALAGPYVDRLGNRMLEGGGSRVLTSRSAWRGPGSNALIQAGESWYHVYHSYDAAADGMPTLRVAELSWGEGGWPESGGP
ncbi:uncharacterized protein SOCE26_097480 [Sorangium cellulosum]|uniref:Arabinan endo-1,5-alpha-L-arabinosidase n=1 Tax=Sorangium cellulosum TaxID=56 RepID=A0A2L0F9M3_SORCE|nr:arabinan endo-1,5-alpha-L-arabinosidase [Sorangium cellulosum]AUX48217.1 uncharacterized protein SOCE26_097480 [Sorangium cellulosum]